MAKASKLSAGDEFTIKVPVEVIEIFEDRGRTKVHAKLLNTLAGVHQGLDDYIPVPTVKGIYL
jgi:hypothetical protein